MHASIHVCAGVHMHTCSYGVQRLAYGVVPQDLLSFLRKDLSLALWSFPARLSWMASEFQGPTCLHMLRVENLSVHRHTWLFTWVLGTKLETP